jgi:PAS domain-containing protein
VFLISSIRIKKRKNFFFNKSFEVFLGYQSVSLTGFTLYDLIHPEDMETLKRRHKYGKSRDWILRILDVAVYLK